MGCSFPSLMAPDRPREHPCGVYTTYGSLILHELLHVGSTSVVLILRTGPIIPAGPATRAIPTAPAGPVVRTIPTAPAGPAVRTIPTAPAGPAVRALPARPQARLYIGPAVRAIPTAPAVPSRPAGRPGLQIRLSALYRCTHLATSARTPHTAD